VQEQVKNPCLQIFYFFNINIKDFWLELFCLVHELLEQFDDRVDNVLIMTVNKRKYDLEMLTEEMVLVLFAWKFYYFNYLQNQSFGAIFTYSCVEDLRTLGRVIDISFIVNM